jgi:pilus assembly protein CpaE
MGRNRLVMVADPNRESRTHAVELLRDAPYAVVADTDHGREASSIAAQTQPEIVLVAVEEPLEPALATIDEIRQLLPDCQVIVYSSLSDVTAMRRVLQSGVCDLLPTPLERDDLLAALDRLSVQAGAQRPELDEAPAAPAEARTQRGTIVTVFGAKGGIGKSTIATNLAAAIAGETDHSVLVMDMDTRFGDIAIMLDIEPRYTIADLAQRAHELDRETFRSALIEHSSGAYVLAAPKHPSEWGNIDAEQMQAVVHYAAQWFDYVILDTPGTFNDIVATSIEVADRVLITSSLDMASIKDTVHMLDLLEAEGYPADRLHLVVNQVNRATTVRSEDVPRIVHKDVYWSIPYDEQVVYASAVGQPVVQGKPKSRAAKELRGLAFKLTDGERTEAVAPSRGWMAALGLSLPWWLVGRRAAV